MAPLTGLFRRATAAAWAFAPGEDPEEEPAEPEVPEEELPELPDEKELAVEELPEEEPVPLDSPLLAVLPEAELSDADSPAAEELSPLEEDSPEEAVSPPDVLSPPVAAVAEEAPSLPGPAEPNDPPDEAAIVVGLWIVRL